MTVIYGFVYVTTYHELTACSLIPPNTNEGMDLTVLLSGSTTKLNAALT